jgi:putative ABC transport system substrate-binding protein
MRRRTFIAALGSAAAWPLVARGQQRAFPVVGILGSGGTDDEDWVLAFRKGLSETGYAEGRNVAIEFRSTKQYDLLPKLAAELVRARVAVLGAIGGPSAPAAKAATATIPIVFSIGGDPVELGLVTSLNHPGGNITGATFFTEHVLQKQISILQELVPKAAVFGFLVNPDNPKAQTDVSKVQVAARTLGLAIHVMNASDDRGVDAAFAALVQHNAQAVIITGDPLFFRISARLAALAAQHGLPATFARRSFAEAGGLVTYGANAMDSNRQAGIYAGRILRGEQPR